MKINAMNIETKTVDLTIEQAANESSYRLSRRDYLKLVVPPLIGCASTTISRRPLQAASSPTAKSIAAVVTIYRRDSHADVILGKILEGWKHDLGRGPTLKLAALYVDQFPSDDLARSMCDKYGVPIFESIEKALTIGGDHIAVDGVISIGEHGDYPHNEFGQHLYPRKRFFAQIADAMEKHERVVPVFNDKHLGPTWTDAKWMYDRAAQMKIPFMAGSSMPVGFRIGKANLPLGCELECAVGIGYSGLDVYGSHALEFYQYHVERRRGAEQGVKSVQCLSGPEIWKVVDSGRVSRAAFEAAFAIVPKQGQLDPRQDEAARLFLFEYTDGMVGAVFMLGCVSGTGVGLKLKGIEQPFATAFDERSEPRYPHFAYLVKAIERMMHTRRVTYPVERTLLTSGILDAALHSLAQDGKAIATPHLAISYQPVAYPHADEVDLNS